jgi:hypothetical protein
MNNKTFADDETRIATPLGQVTILALSADRIVISTKGWGRERPVRVRGQSVRVEFDLCQRGGRWKLSEHSFTRIGRMSDLRSLPARSQASVIRAIVPSAAAWAQAHPEVMRRADREAFTANHRGLYQEELPSLAEHLQSQAQILAWHADFHTLAAADPNVYGRIEELADTLRAVATDVSGLSQEIGSISYAPAA